MKQEFFETCLRERRLLAIESLSSLFKDGEDLANNGHVTDTICLVFSSAYVLLVFLLESKLVLAWVGEELPRLTSEELNHSIEEKFSIKVEHSS